MKNNETSAPVAFIAGLFSFTFTVIIFAMVSCFITIIFKIVSKVVN